MTVMDSALIDEAIELVEKANANLEVELLDRATARRLLAAYARARRVVDFRIADLSRKLDDAAELARVTGTPTGTAKAVTSIATVLATSTELSAALQHGDISLDQAAEIAAAEEAAPGAAAELVAIAQNKSFHVLRDRARKTRLEAEQHRDLGARQRAARHARSHCDGLGMVHVHLAWEPHVGTPIPRCWSCHQAKTARDRKAGRLKPPDP
jgi:hypothetical protein